MKLQKSIKVSITVGIYKGYFARNSSSSDSQGEPFDKRQLVRVSSVWGMIASKVCSETGVYVSSIISEARADYPEKYGCPTGGEKVYVITSSFNPEYGSSKEEWLTSVDKCIQYIKEELKQSTITAEYTGIYLQYLKD